jgi:integrase
MATITKRSGSWFVRVRSKGQTAVRTFPKKDAAIKWARDTEDQFVAGSSSSAGLRTTIGEVVKLYLAALKRDEDTKDKREPRRLTAWWNKRIGNMKLGDVSPMVLTKHLRAFDDAAPATFNHYLTAVSRLFRYAADNHLMTTNPARLVRRRKVSNDGTGRALDIEESRKLFAACDASTNTTAALAIRLALECGPRQGEILRAKARDFDAAKSTLLLRDTKNGTDRTIGLPAALVARLREHLRVRPLDDDRLFRLTVAQLDNEWRRIRAKAEMSWRPRFHDLRHSALTRIANSGATLAEMKAVSGHKTAQMVLRYMHTDKAPVALIQRAALE